MTDYLPKCPKWVPPECVEAARAWLSEGNGIHEANCQRIISHPRLRDFWPRVARLFDKRWRAQGRPGTPRRGELVGLYRSLIVQMTLQGGELPHENPSDKRERRRNAADTLHRLRDLVQQDEDLSRMTVCDLIKICAKAEEEQVRNRGQEAEYILQQYKHPDHEVTAAPMIAMAGPRLLDILCALQERCEKFQPLHTFDDTETSTPFPQAQREDRQRLWLERQLAYIFIRHLGGLHQGLLAVALQVALNNPSLTGSVRKEAGPALEDRNIGARFRRWVARKRTISGKTKP